MSITTRPTIHPQDLYAKQQSAQTVHLIDVRTPAEYRAVHVASAQLVPLDDLDPEALMAAHQVSFDTPLYLICRTGARAQQAWKRLHDAGFVHVACVEGGTEAWEQAGLPVVRGRAVISLDRQVRMAAGLLVLLGVGVGFLVHPAFSALAAFVGAGLLFAGLTDTCGMAMLLAKMPWNQVREGSGP
jgi:rhodanese-related sulfurtransferase